MAQCATTALAGAVPRPCVRGARGRFGGLGPVPGVVSLPFPPSRPACPALRVAGRPVRVSLTLARWYAIPRGLCVPRARSGSPSGSPRVPFACVCARAPAASAPPPHSVVWPAHLARSRHWALVGPFHVVRAAPRVLPRSLAPSGVLGGGRSGPRSPLRGCCCEGRLRSGAPPPPTAHPLRGLLGSATHVLWARVFACGGPTLSPWPACPSGAACRGGGVVGGRPRGGVACHCCEGRLVSGAVPPPTARPLGGLPGPPTHWLWVRGGAGVGTHHQPHRARSCELALRAVGAARGRPGGGASCLGVGRPESGALPPPSARPLGRLPGPTTHWLWVRGGCGRGDPSPTPQRALLRAGFARCGGGTRAPGGGRLLPGCGASGVGRSPTPDCPPSGRAARAHYPLAVGAGGCGRGDPSPAPQRAVASWLCVLWGRHEGALGGRFLPGCGASGVGRSPTPDCPPSGRAAGAHYPLAVGAGGCGRGDPSPTSQRALLRAGFARCGGGTRAPGGGASCLGVGRPGSGALSPPTAHPLGGLPGPTTYRLWVRGGCGRGEPSPAPQRALLRAGFACCGGGMRVPGGGASCLGVGRPGSGALPPPTARPLGGLPGPTTHWLWVRGAAGVGTHHQPHSARSCELALRAVGAE